MKKGNNMSVISENVSYYHNVKYSSLQQLYRTRKMHGIKRVIVFCIFIVVLPAILIITPLYLRQSVFADIIYPVAESDIIEIRDGISSIFCEKHALHMNTTFNAFQLQSKPEISTNRKHIRLKKSMTLPDDTLEYWGFYLLKGAIVKLKVCSRYDGSRILLVKGDRNLKTCGLLEHNKNKFDAHYAGGYGVVNVTFEPIAEEIVSEENSKPQKHEQQQSTLLPILLQSQDNNHQNYESGAEKLLMMSNNNRQSRNNFEATNFNDHRGVGGGDGGVGGDGDGRIQKRNQHHTMTSVKEIKIKKNADRNRFENFDRYDENHGGEDYSDDDENDNDGGGGDNDNSNISGNSSNKNVNINSNSLVNKLQLKKYENKFFNILESQNNNNNNNHQKNIKINVKNNGGHNDANNNDKSSLISKLETEFENLSNNNSSGSSNSNESINNNNNTNSNERIYKHNDNNKRIRHKRHYHNKNQQQQQQQQQTTQQKHHQHYHNHHHHHHHQYKNVEDEKEEEKQKHMKELQDEHYKRKKEIMKQLFDENNKLSKSKQYQIKNNPQQQEQQQQQQQNSKNQKNHPDDHMEQNQQQTLHLLNKRDTVYDAKIAHGGNALNFTDTESNSVSSFENSLLTCYDGQILLAKSFNPSSLCTSVHYLANSTHMIATHEIQEDGYYYYIFYSDNDLFRNDIHALFDIYKPTYQYTNITDSKGCVNETDCLFPIKFLSDEIVVVEVPTRDGIEHEEDDITYLISTCHPRMSVYVIFPISLLILILSCSFL